ncbi:MAG TPA: hypothetical protein VIU37_08545 [Candidatus Limnocylindrales bacterium]
MAGLNFHLNDMTGLYGRILGIKSPDRDAGPAEATGRAVLSGHAKRRRILEEARSAVLDRIRRTR